jgi:glycosyltransferase involved in cell wall biosynthesis
MHESPLKYAIVQPWFMDPGHPAQSLIRTYRVIKSDVEVTTIVYAQDRVELPQHLNTYIQECQAEVVSCPQLIQTLLKTLAAGTFVTLDAIAKLSRQENLSIFFLDVNLYILAIGLKWYRPKLARMNVLCMVGPEFYQRNLRDRLFKWNLVCSLFKYHNFHLFLRTNELANSWKLALPELAERIDYLPSLELHGKNQHYTLNKFEGKTFTISGQIRSQKFIRPLVELFSKEHPPGNLRLSGKFVEAELKSFVETHQRDNISIDDRFLKESEMLEELSKSQYSLMLYDPWDDRMESSMLFLSIECCVPIIAFEGGWLGDRVREEGIGWTISSKDTSAVYEFLKSLPDEHSLEYQQIVTNIKDCYLRWTSPKTIDLFLTKLGWNTL